MKCEKDCGQEATVRCTWGTDSRQTVVVCQFHARQLWKEPLVGGSIESRVNAGSLFWINEEI